MPRSIGFVCPDLVPLLLESTVAPYREAAVQALHLAEGLRALGWELTFLTPVAGAKTDSVIPSRLGAAHVIAGGAAPVTRWSRWRHARRVDAALDRLGVEVALRWDAPATGLGAPWRRRSTPVAHVLTGERWMSRRRRGGLGWRLRPSPNLLVPSQAFRDRVDAPPQRTHVLAPGFPLPPAPRTDRAGVVWIGPLDRDCGADVLLDMAESFPSCRFNVCVQPGADVRYAQRFELRARQSDNVVLHANASYREVVRQLSLARVLLSTTRTSDLAARVVLAWLHGAVLVSLSSDPDHVLRKLRLGLVASDPHDLCEATRQTLEDDELCVDLRARAREYAAEQFDIQRIARSCEQIVETLRHS